MESNIEKNLIISEDALFVQIKQLLDDARSHIARTVNTAIVNTYWQIGKCIVEHEQKGSQRAEYGRGVITSLSKRLSDEYGNGFSATNLKTMRQFYLCFPKGHALRDKLSWTHWRTLLKVQDEVARDYYLTECIAENVSDLSPHRRGVENIVGQLIIAENDCPDKAHGSALRVLPCVWYECVKNRYLIATLML